MHATRQSEGHLNPPLHNDCQSGGTYGCRWDRRAISVNIFSKFNENPSKGKES